MPEYLFVYGTLKRGYPLGAWLEGSKFLRLGQIAGMKMYDLGPFPCVVPQELGETSSRNFGQRILGEIFEVSQETLDLLDEVESEMFDRVYYLTTLGMRVNVYIWHDDKLPAGATVIEGGVWRKK